MEETILKIIRPTVKGKKYTAIIVERKTKKERKISFGSIGYSQYKDQTPLKLYSSNNSLDMKRRKAYFNRHSNEDTKAEALSKEIAKSGGRYNAKILSHKYLW
jgi:hypothetical protein